MVKKDALELRFAVTACDRCGGARLLRQPCPDCGLAAKVHEVQPDVDRRRDLVAAFRAGRKQAPGESVRPEHALQQFSQAMGNAQRALAGAAKRGRDATALIRAFGELDDLVEMLERPRLRPHRNAGRAHGRAARSIRDGLDLFVEALEAPTLLSAQDLEGRGQRLLDAGSEIMRQANEQTETWTGVYELPQHEVAAGLGMSARRIAGGDGLSLAELDARLQRIHAGSGSTQTGAGLELHVMRGLLTTALDLEQAAQITTSAERRLLASDGLRELLAWPSWIPEHNRGTALLSAALFGLASLQDDASDLERMDQLLTVLTKCRETLIPHYVATIAAHDGPDYDRLRMTKTSGALISAGSRDYPDLLIDEHLDSRLRHASAHSEFDVVGEDVLIRFARGGEVLIPADEVIDAVLSHVELVAALYLALSGAAAALGLQLGRPTHASPRDLKIALQLVGSFAIGAPVEADIDGSTVSLTFEGTVEKFLPMAAAAAAVLPETVEHIRAGVSDPQGATRICTAPLSAFRENSSIDADTVAGLLAYARLCGQAEVNGSSWLSPAQWDAVAQRITTLAEGLPPTERNGPVRQIRAWARAAGADRAVETCTAWMRERRLGADRG